MTAEPLRLDVSKETPAPYRAMAELGRSIELEPRLRELVNVRASMINGCAFCVDLHTKLARKAGESEQRLYALATWEEAPFFDERERAAFALTDAVTLIHRDHVPRRVWDEAAAHFEPPELGHLVWAIAAINTWNRIATGTRMPPGNHDP